MDDDDNDMASDASSSFSAAVDAESDAEQPYERIPRTKPAAPKPRDTKELPRLPIKMTDGRVKGTGSRTVANNDPSEHEDESDEEVWAEPEMPKVEDVTTGARFGRPAVVDVLRIPARKLRVQTAKEQIASLCQEIIADPENNVRLLTAFTATCDTYCIRYTIARTAAPTRDLLPRAGYLSRLPGSRTERPHHPQARLSLSDDSLQGHCTWLPYTCSHRQGEVRKSQPDGPAHS